MRRSQPADIENESAHNEFAELGRRNANLQIQQRRRDRVSQPIDWEQIRGGVCVECAGSPVGGKHRTELEVAQRGSAESDFGEPRVESRTRAALAPVTERPRALCRATTRKRDVCREKCERVLRA